MQSIIITADDFGFSEEINEAVERGHRDGVLSAASLMVSAPAAADAVARAKRLPNLRVGLHVVLVQGTPTLPPEEVDALTGPNGRFPDDLAAAGVNWFFSPRARRQLRREVAAQFKAFRATGLRLDHVNAHNHMHIHPTVLSAILNELKGQENAAVRLPREPWSVGSKEWSAGRSAAFAERCIMAPWLKLMELRLKRRGIKYNNWIMGLAATGQVDEVAMLRFVDSLPDGVIEVYCHPATRGPGAGAETMSGYGNEGELAALLSDKVRQRLVEKDLRVGGFCDVGVPST
jgi:hopanoid biosynthesis associated protein HpnK